MNFNEEWAQLVADAKARQSARTQLNSAGGSGSGEKKLNVTPSVLRERAGRSEDKVAKDFREAQKSAAKTASEVPGTMKGFSADEALADFMETWEKKVRHVTGLLGSEGIAGALRSAADLFETEDGKRKKEIQKVQPYKPGDIL